jgi:hypothetical protein
LAGYGKFLGCALFIRLQLLVFETPSQSVTKDAKSGKKRGFNLLSEEFIVNKFWPFFWDFYLCLGQ